MNARSTKVSKRLSLAVLGLALMAPSFAACTAATGELVSSSGEAITSCGGTDNGGFTCSNVGAPSPLCYGDPPITLIAGVDANDTLDAAPVVTWGGSCSYALNAGATTDDAQKFITAMQQLGAPSPIPISSSNYKTPGSVFLGYNLTSYVKTYGLTGVTALVNQYACNSVVAPGLFFQGQGSRGDCVGGKVAAVASYLLVFDPTGCGSSGCAGRGGGGI